MTRRSLLLSILSLLGTVLLVIWFFSGKTLSKVSYQAAFERVNQETVADRVAPFLGQPFWEADLESLHARLLQLEWVHRARVTRRWPNQLRIRLEEQTPVARWGEQALLNQFGDIFYPTDIQPFDAYVRLDGPAVRAKLVLKRLGQLQSRLQALDWRISGLTMLPDGVFQVDLEQKRRLLLPEDNQAAVLERFIRSYPRIQSDLRKFAQVFDLRYSNGFVIRKNTEPDASNQAPPMNENNP
ncbi:cell division protein FtsQ/DivIB [Thiomicrospira sp. WB1]|uniref:cell division protein FtsQ/DivIB n=1 Tax=Thiomicrospira sp. WB1 TaxID=1685380 RepID=UPI000749F938|nr:FtsQ-type POTRA domain-containing protein [Thiomicrospira sp. WB1]KUJ71404.1 hypothetical protein AVO41_07695 [Thiomicrospira sp. WB1]